MVFGSRLSWRARRDLGISDLSLGTSNQNGPPPGEGGPEARVLGCPSAAPTRTSLVPKRGAYLGASGTSLVPSRRRLGEETSAAFEKVVVAFVPRSAYARDGFPRRLAVVPHRRILLLARRGPPRDARRGRPVQPPRGHDPEGAAAVHPHLVQGERQREAAALLQREARGGPDRRARARGRPGEGLPEHDQDRGGAERAHRRAPRRAPRAQRHRRRVLRAHRIPGASARGDPRPRRRRRRGAHRRGGRARHQHGRRHRRDGPQGARGLPTR